MQVDDVVLPQHPQDFNLTNGRLFGSLIACVGETFRAYMQSYIDWWEKEARLIPSLSLNFLIASSLCVSLFRQRSTTPYAPSPMTPATSNFFID
jgi:hypothetical protein|eukprot:SAG25_NODE_222_length_11605_cov_6.982357_12_plen_94_part_00